MEILSPWILDGLTIIIVYLFVVHSSQKGFATSAVSLLGYIGSFVAAIILSKIGAVFIYEIILKDNLLKLLMDNIENVTDTEILTQQLTLAVESLPKYIINMLNFETGGFSYQINSMVNDSSDKIANIVLTTMIAPVIKTALKVILFMITFVICNIIAKIAMQVTKFVRKIPVIGAIDGLLGGILGILEGVFFMFLVAVAINFLIMITNNAMPFVTSEIIEQTYIFNKLTSIGKLIGI